MKEMTREVNEISNGARDAVFDPNLIREYIKPMTEEELNALTPEQRQARLGILKMVQNGLMTPKQIKAQKRKNKFSARLQKRLNSPK